MNLAPQIYARAGSVISLPFFLFIAILLQAGVDLVAREDAVLKFQEFESNCIDLGRYDATVMELTVRFVGAKPERFYRYSKVPAGVWQKLRALNEKGGIGEYFNETVVQHPEKYPFKEMTVRSFKRIPKKKAEDSK